MAKIKTRSVLELNASLKKEIFPVYYIFGEDTLGIRKAAEQIAKATAPLLTNEMDKETFFGSSTSIDEVLFFADSFPFGSEKKVAIIKEAEKVKDIEKKLPGFLKNPPSFSVLVFLHDGTPERLDKSYFKQLDALGGLFESAVLKGAQLIKWITDRCAEAEKKIDPGDAQLFLDMIGEDRYQIEQQLEKIFLFAKDKAVITLDMLRAHLVQTRMYTVFELQDALGARDVKKAFRIADRMLENGESAIFLLGSLQKYFQIITRVRTAQSSGNPEQEAKRMGIHPYVYKKSSDAARYYGLADLYRIAKALYIADTQLKTSATDERIVLAQFLANIKIAEGEQ